MMRKVSDTIVQKCVVHNFFEHVCLIKIYATQRVKLALLSILFNLISLALPFSLMPAASSMPAAIEAMEKTGTLQPTSEPVEERTSVPFVREEVSQLNFDFNVICSF